MQEHIAYKITGHVPDTEGRKYGEATPADMAEALRKFPRYEID
jgi:hypothetical protein